MLGLLHVWHLMYHCHFSLRNKETRSCRFSSTSHMFVAITQCCTVLWWLFLVNQWCVFKYSTVTLTLARRVVETIHFVRTIWSPSGNWLFSWRASILVLTFPQSNSPLWNHWWLACSKLVNLQMLLSGLCVYMYVCLVCLTFCVLQEHSS